MNPTSLPWFRLYTEFANDPKVQSMNESLQRRLIMLFCMQGSNHLSSADEDELMFYMRLSQEDLDITRTTFIKKGFIEIAENGQWMLKNWDKRQQVAVSAGAARQRRFRDKKKGTQNAELPGLESFPEDSSGGVTSRVTSLVTVDKSRRDESRRDENRPESTYPPEEDMFAEQSGEVSGSGNGDLYIVLKGGSYWYPDDVTIDRWKLCYPNIDIRDAILKACAWTDANTAKRPQNPKMFMSKWLSKSEERALSKAVFAAVDPADEAFDFSTASEDFVAVFEIYPSHRRSGVAAAWEAWQKHFPSGGAPDDQMEAVADGISRWKSSEEWQRDSGRYVPGIGRFIGEKRWLNAPSMTTPKFGDQSYRKTYDAKPVFEPAV